MINIWYDIAKTEHKAAISIAEAHFTGYEQIACIAELAYHTTYGHLPVWATVVEDVIVENGKNVYVWRSGDEPATP